MTTDTKLKMKEAQLLSFALSLLEKSGLIYWRVPNGPVMHTLGGRVFRKQSPIKGMPDIAGILPNGRFFAIELKTKTGRISPEQSEWIRKINMSNGMAVVMRSPEEIITFINAAKKTKGQPIDQPSKEGNSMI